MEECIEEFKNCLTCKYWEYDACGPECLPCRFTTNGMTGWTPVEKEEKTVKEHEKTLSEYSIEDLKAEIEKRESDEEKKKWIDGFVMGDYYKVTLGGAPDRFAIIRADKVTILFGEEYCILCTNVYDHGMGWINTPFIRSDFKTTTKYIVEHLNCGYKAETM